MESSLEMQTSEEVRYRKTPRLEESEEENQFEKARFNFRAVFQSHVFKLLSMEQVQNEQLIETDKQRRKRESEFMPEFGAWFSGYYDGAGKNITENERKSVLALYELFPDQFDLLDFMQQEQNTEDSEKRKLKMFVDEFAMRIKKEYLEQRILH